MKYLIGLAILQALVLGFLSLRVMEIDAQTDEIAKASAVMYQAAVTGDAAQAAPPSLGEVMAVNPTADEIREVIREELAALDSGSAAKSQAKATNNTTDNNNGNSASSADSAYLTASVNQDLDYYIGRGNIGEVEMADLQLKIARLPADQRRETMSRLAKAMSAGELKGQM